MVNVWEEIIRLHHEGHNGILVTVVDKKGMGPVVTGRKMLISDTGVTIGTVGGGELEARALKKAEELIIKQENALESFNLSGMQLGEADANLNMICGGSVTLFFEYLSIPPTIYIMGMGHVGCALADIMEKLDWRVVPIKYKSEPHHGSDRYPAQALADFIEKGTPPAGAFVVIAGYSHDEDYQMLKAVYKAGWQPLYIGLLGSLHKSTMVVSKLVGELGNGIDLGVLHSPVGLDIGGNTPQEIALSIAAEIQSIRYGKTSNRHLGGNWTTYHNED
ncbi:MAG: XdhC family protein [Methylocystaceae bacterium]